MHDDNDLDTSTSVIVASETCLCLKSYLIGCWIRPSQIRLGMHRISGSGASNHAGRLVIYSTFGVTHQGQAKSSDTGSKTGRRHLGDGMCVSGGSC